MVPGVEDMAVPAKKTGIPKRSDGRKSGSKGSTIPKNGDTGRKQPFRASKKGTGFFAPPPQRLVQPHLPPPG
jgi:hypothetical protein